MKRPLDPPNLDVVVVFKIAETKLTWNSAKRHGYYTISQRVKASERVFLAALVKT